VAETIKQLKKDYAICFDTLEGKRVFDDIRRSYQTKSSYSKDPFETAFREGQRSVFLRMLNLSNLKEVDFNE
jgi:hypothetical protein